MPVTAHERKKVAEYVWSVYGRYVREIIDQALEENMGLCLDDAEDREDALEVIMDALLNKPRDQGEGDDEDDEDADEEDDDGVDDNDAEHDYYPDRAPDYSY